MGKGNDLNVGFYLYDYLKSFLCLGSLFFWLKNTLTPLCLYRDETKEQSGKNITLTLTKILHKKYGQITLSTYKLDFQNKNYI